MLFLHACPDGSFKADYKKVCKARARVMEGVPCLATPLDLCCVQESSGSIAKERHCPRPSSR